MGLGLRSPAWKWANVKTAMMGSDGEGKAVEVKDLPEPPYGYSWCAAWVERSGPLSLPHWFLTLDLIADKDNQCFATLYGWRLKIGNFKQWSLYTVAVNGCTCGSCEENAQPFKPFREGGLH